MFLFLLYTHSPSMLHFDALRTEIFYVLIHLTNSTSTSILLEQRYTCSYSSYSLSIYLDALNTEVYYVLIPLTHYPSTSMPLDQRYACSFSPYSLSEFDVQVSLHLIRCYKRGTYLKAQKTIAQK